MRRVIVPALTALFGSGVLGAALYLSEAPQPARPPARPNALAPAVPGPSAFGWRLARSMSADRALVLEVETTRPGESVAIAQQLTEPYKEQFDEVLVFFFEPNTTPRRARLRVQWTRALGYRTLILRGSE